jgi:hypothetical protein
MLVPIALIVGLVYLLRPESTTSETERIRLFTDIPSY